MAWAVATSASARGERDTTRHLANVVGALALAVTDVLAEEARAGGCLPAERAAVVLVGTVDGVSQEDLRRRLGLSQPGTTRLVDRLVARGLIVRAAGPNRRTNALRLTAAGRREARGAQARRRELLGGLTSGLTPEEQRVLAVLVDRVLGALVRSGSSPWRTCRECDQAGCEAGGWDCPVELARLDLERPAAPQRC